MLSFISTLIDFASYFFILLIISWIAFLSFSTPEASTTNQRDEQLGPQVRTVASSEAISARLAPVAPLTFRAFSVTPLPRDTKPNSVVSDNGGFSKCLDKLSIKEISPRVARSIRPIISCQKTISSSDASIETIIACFDKLTVKDSAPRLPRSQASIVDFEMSAALTNLSVDFSASTKARVKEPALRPCLKYGHVFSNVKKSVTFTTLASMPSVVKSEIRFYEPTLRPGKKFPCFSEQERAEIYLSASNYPHEFGRTSIVEEAGNKFFLLKELGTFHSPPEKRIQRFENFT